MERIKLKTKEIVVADNDYKYSSHLMFEKLKRSIDKYGQLRPINCIMENDKYICVEGKFILKAMIECKVEEIEVNLHQMNKTEYLSLQLIMNDLYFKKCDLKTAESLSSMQSIDYSSLPFQKDEIDSFIKLLNFDWAEFERRKESLVQISMFDVIEEEYSEIGNCLLDIINTDGEKDVISESLDKMSNSIDKVNEIIEQVREEYPANIEGSEEFNIANKEELKTQETIIRENVSPEDLGIFDIQEVVENKEEVLKQVYVPFLYHVFIDEKNNFKIIAEDKMDEYEKDGYKIISLFKGSFSDCRVFINQNEQI